MSGVRGRGDVRRHYLSQNICDNILLAFKIGADKKYSASQKEH